MLLTVISSTLLFGRKRFPTTPGLKPQKMTKLCSSQRWVHTLWKYFEKRKKTIIVALICIDSSLQPPLYPCMRNFRLIHHQVHLADCWAQEITRCSEYILKFSVLRSLFLLILFVFSYFSPFYALVSSSYRSRLTLQRWLLPCHINYPQSNISLILCFVSRDGFLTTQQQSKPLH